MKDRLTICAVTGARADWGLLQPVIAAMAASRRLRPLVVATGMHFSPTFGSTYRAIEADGFRLAGKVPIDLSRDTPAAIATAMGQAVIGFAACFERLRPDMLLVLGDRFEILAAAQAALVRRLPVAHIGGGDVTEGAIDEAIRHSLTKMSHVHFVATATAARRVRQLGENPHAIHVVGSPGLDRLRRSRLLDRAEFEHRAGIRLRPRNLLVTFHPVTLAAEPAEKPFRALLEALAALGPEVGLIFTRPNADTFGRVLNAMIDRFVKGRDNAAVHTAMGHPLYLSALRHVDAVVGNSSSGLLEAPSLGTPTVNVGERQRGRERAASVIDAPAEAKAIGRAIARAFAMDCAGVKNPYGDGKASARIVKVLEGIRDLRSLVLKKFFDLPARR